MAIARNPSIQVKQFGMLPLAKEYVCEPCHRVWPYAEWKAEKWDGMPMWMCPSCQMRMGKLKGVAWVDGDVELRQEESDE
jgi:hypothetical protein